MRRELETDFSAPCQKLLLMRVSGGESMKVRAIKEVWLFAIIEAKP